MDQSTNNGKDDPLVSNLEYSNTFELNPQASEDEHVNVDPESSSYDAEEDTEAESTSTPLAKSQRQKHTKVIDTKFQLNFDSSSSSDVPSVGYKYYKLLPDNESLDATLISGENKSKEVFNASSSDEYLSTDNDNVDVKKKRRIIREREAFSPEKIRRKKNKRLSDKTVSSPSLAWRNRPFSPLTSKDTIDTNAEFDNAEGNYPLQIVRRATVSSEDEIRNVISVAPSYVSTENVNSDNLKATCKPSTPIPIPAKPSTKKVDDFRNSPEPSVQYVGFWKYDKFSSSSGASKNQNTKKKKLFYIGSSESLSEQKPDSPSSFENPDKYRTSIFYNPQPFKSNNPRSLRATESIWNNLHVEAAAGARKSCRGYITPQTPKNINFGPQTSTGAVPRRPFLGERGSAVGIPVMTSSDRVGGNRSREEDEVRSLNDLPNTRLQSLKRAVTTMFRRLASLKRGLSAAKEERPPKTEETD